MLWLLAILIAVGFFSIIWLLNMLIFKYPDIFAKIVLGIVVILGAGLLIQSIHEILLFWTR